MPKPQPIQISIPHPCDQNWEEMTPVGEGRHCDHCAKTVIDFTSWSDEAIYTYFAKDKYDTCGRFFTAQTGRSIYLPYQPHSQLYRMTIALGLTLLFAQTPQLLAQTRPPIATQGSAPDQTMKQDNTAQPSGERKGMVLDVQKKPLANITVQVSQNTTSKGSATTDSNGNYCITPLAPGSYVLVAVGEGHQTVEKRINVGKNRPTTHNFMLNDKTESKFTMGKPAAPPQSIIDRAARKQARRSHKQN